MRGHLGALHSDQLTKRGPAAMQGLLSASKKKLQPPPLGAVMVSLLGTSLEIKLTMDSRSGETQRV